MEKLIILQGITSDQFYKQLELIVEMKLNKIIEKFKPSENTIYVTRKEVGELLKISLPTLHEWTKLGFINSYKIGNRVLYRKKEIEESLNNKKYKRN